MTITWKRAGAAALATTLFATSFAAAGSGAFAQDRAGIADPETAQTEIQLPEAAAEPQVRFVASETVQERFEQLRIAHNAIEAGMARVDLEGGVTKVLLHSFAHLLIRQLAFDSGYDSSSICERIYASDGPDGMAGVLLYTASGDSEGTLGGLVRQGRPEYLPSTVSAALENGRYCSSDPLCVESTGQGLNSLNLAACHSCSLLPETSCEMSNMLLDRALVIGHPSKSKLAYFAG